MQLDELLAAFKKLPEAQRAELRAKATKDKHTRFRIVPNVGPQADGYHSRADVLLFGGSPGGGKSVLEIALAVNEHRRSLIVRKNFADLDGIIDTAKKLLNTSDGFVGGNRPLYRKPDGGVIHFSGVASDGGIGGAQGVDHDLICFDEAAQFPEEQIRLYMGWLRTDRPGQRCRVILASNPPLDSVGDWMIEFFAPWLNPAHPNPAIPGELRYFLPVEGGKDRECGRDDTTLIDGVTVHAQSRTFIPSKFTDNPFYDAKEYAKTLSHLPAQVREILTTGNFMLARQDDPWQLIPTPWVKAAQARWTPMPPKGSPLCAIGVDVASGGDDNTVLSKRHDWWFAPLAVTPGKQTPLGSDVAGLVFSHLRDDATVCIDMGGGYGGGPYELLKENGVTVYAYKGSEAASGRTKDGKLKLSNKRTEALWRLRELLDPDQLGGSPVMFPYDPELVADLTSVMFKVGPHGIQATPKEKVVELLGRSPDKGDAVVMASYVGQSVANVRGGRSARKKDVTVNLGRFATRRH